MTSTCNIHSVDSVQYTPSMCLFTVTSILIRLVVDDSFYVYVRLFIGDKLSIKLGWL